MNLLTPAVSKTAKITPNDKPMTSYIQKAASTNSMAQIIKKTVSPKIKNFAGVFIKGLFKYEIVIKFKERNGTKTILANVSLSESVTSVVNC